MPLKRPSGMTAFTIAWIGQVVSLIGTSMTAFAVTVWAFELTGSATVLALVGFFYVTPMLVFSPLAGAIVDRANRKLMMVLSDLASGAATGGILILYLSGNLQIWHLYVANVIMGLFQTFQWPAYSAAITVMLPKEHYGRANGMMSLAESGSNIFAPLLAGMMLGFVGLGGVLFVDIVTFLFAITALAMIHIPQPPVTDAGKEGQGNLVQEAVYGFRYILKRPSLLGLQSIFLAGNFFSTITFIVLAPMILSRTGNNELAYGSVSSAGAIGGVLGGLLMSAWGGPKRLVHGVLIGWVMISLMDGVLMGVGRSLPVWIIASFLAALFNPIINGSNQAIWQAKVAPDVQGRVFSIRRLIAWFVTPLATLVAGPLADFVLEPRMRVGGELTATFGWLVGEGPGAGMALMFVFCGALAALVGLSGYLVPAIRDVETILPDHAAAASASADPIAEGGNAIAPL